MRWVEVVIVSCYLHLPSALSRFLCARRSSTRLSSARDLMRVRVVELTAQPITARVITARMTEPSNPSTSTPPPFAAQHFESTLPSTTTFPLPAFSCCFYTRHTSQWQPYEHTARPCNQSSDSPRNLHRPADALSASKRKDALSRHSAHAYSLTNVL